ncbi:MAG: response regulator [Hahellaceae bacterium]|nr:response regulator [Hahellaceae bacterium]
MWFQLVQRLRRYPLGTQVMASVLVFSSFVAILSIAFQLYYDYGVEKTVLARRIESLVQGLEPGLANSLWMIDEQSTVVILEGMLNIPEIYNVSLTTTEGKTYVLGTPPQGEPSISQSAELFSNAPQPRKLGDLTVLASLKPLYAILWDRAVIILSAQFIKTVIIVTFFLFIFWWLVSRHLEALSNIAQSITEGRQTAPVQLKRRKGRRDELSRVSDAFNLLSKRILEQQHTIDVLQSEEDERSEIARSDLLDYLDFFKRTLRHIEKACFDPKDERESSFKFSPPVQPPDWSEVDYVHVHSAASDLIRLMSLVGHSPVRRQEEFDLPLLLEQSVDRLESAVLGKEIDLQIIMDESLPRRVIGDQQGFQQIVENLIAGLAVLSEPTKLVLLGQVISRIDSQYLRVRINAEDNGRCLPGPLLDVLTHMPARLPEKLSIATLAGLLRLVVFREWVVAIGGEFGFKSEAGKGNSVWFEIILRAVPPRPTKGEATLAGQGATVLLAGLQGARLQMLEPQLTSNHCRVMVVGSLLGIENIQNPASGEQEHPDMLIVDGLALGGLDTADLDGLRDFVQQNHIVLTAITLPPGGVLPDALRTAAAGFAVICDDEMPNLLSLYAACKRNLIDLSKTPYISARIERETAAETGQPSERRRVLVADDDTAVQQVTRLMLETLGFDVDSVLNGEDAIERAQRGGYCAIILDCWMPVLNGFEAARRIRKVRPGLALIALSGSQSERTQARVKEAGMDAYLSKPVKMDELKDVLSRLL